MAHETPSRWRKRTARIVEIAKLAGVSTTPVDRVLNERGSGRSRPRSQVDRQFRPVGTFGKGQSNDGSSANGER
ncbi:hypothetical protein CIC12_07755 [Burkholderia sp. SG-MS1]|nr:hypothetical protein [Paraburkholderia sp. SG-MS1]